MMLPFEGEISMSIETRENPPQFGRQQNCFDAPQIVPVNIDFSALVQKVRPINFESKGGYLLRIYKSIKDLAYTFSFFLTPTL